MNTYVVLVIDTQPMSGDEVVIEQAHGPYESHEMADAKRVELYGDVDLVHCCIEVTQLES